ncbi:DUF554 family protein [bacterium]|nr:DUF554 family protein [bacterium]
MFALGTIVNVIAIIAGSLLGLFFGHKLSQKMNKVLIHAIGLFCIGLGLKLFFDSQNSIIIVFSLVVGGVLGALCYRLASHFCYQNSTTFYFRFKHLV